MTAVVDTGFEPSPESQPQTIAELRKFEGELWVKNNDPYKQVNIRTTFGNGQRVDIELAPAGQPDSISLLPKPALELRGFQRMWLRKALTVSSDPNIESEITLLMNQHLKASDARMAETMATIEPGNISRELTEKPCLQCGKVNREGVIEGGRVVQSALDVKNGIPPLCDEHVDMQHLFNPTLVSDDKGEESWKFTPVTLK